MPNNRIPNTKEVDFLFWRILGFLSSLIGLLSYLLSSSFHSIFAEWNTWNIIVYIFVILTVPYSIFYLKTWTLPKNFLFRSHLVFLFLILTSVYSFFYDKRVKEKPDLFNLFSSGSFALTFFSLKVQNIQLGLVDDLLKYFLGLLTVQLTATNLFLSLVGAAFSYFLIVLIPYSGSQSETVFGDITTLQEIVTTKTDTLTYDLRKQLCSILGIENDRENPERFVYPSDFECILNKEIASGRFAEQCLEVFITWRKQVLKDKILTNTAGFQKLSIEEVPKLPLKYLKKDIVEWTKACDLVVKTLFPQERHVCNVVFSGFSPLNVQSFMEICRGLTTQLLEYGNAVSTTTQSPERLFRLVDVLETLKEILPNMESLFNNQNCRFLYDEAIAVSKRLEEAITGVFMEVEYLIRQDPAAKLAVASGGLHPANRYVMNYLRAACRCRNKLERVFKTSQVSSYSSLSEQMLGIVDLLVTNLEANSKIYNNDSSSALCSFFMMNNISYILQEAKDSDLADLLGDDWMQEHISKVSQYLKTYQRSSWDRVLELLNIMDSDDESLVQSHHHARKNLELFKLQFEEICEIQSSWVIFDDRLRNVITSSMRKIIILPAYENFMMKFLKDVETGDYGVQVIESLINKLFLGKDEHTNTRNVQPITWTVVLPSAKDFHEWRKYGEKTILNSTHPRKYYRCIYKNGQGCGARKHVQQIQENPKMYKTCYSGFHTCCF